MYSRAIVQAGCQLIGIVLLCVVMRLVKDMVAMSSNAFSTEHGREAKTFRDLTLAYQVIATFRLANDELADLLSISIGSMSVENIVMTYL